MAARGPGIATPQNRRASFSSSSSSRGCSKHPLPLLCACVSVCVRLCLVPCDLRRSEIYLQCLCSCRRGGACVSWCHVTGPSGMWPPLAACLSSVAHVSLGWVFSSALLPVCVRARDVVPVSTVPLVP